MAIFGRMTARQRLRRATRESLAIPAFSSPIDCTPWVTGGLWPAELSTVSSETASLADYLRADLQRIANGANDELKMTKRAGMPDPARQAAETRIIDDARARAVQRVESTMRQLHEMKAKAAPGYRHQPGVESVAPNSDATQVTPAVTQDAPSEAVADDDTAVGDLEETPVTPADSDIDLPPVAPVEIAPEPGRQPADSGRHHAIVVDEAAAGADEPEPVRNQTAVASTTMPRTEKPIAGMESDTDRVSRILEFVVRQEPRLHWAVGDRVDGTTLLVTDLAHGWIPSGITLPAGVRLLEPERRTGRVSALIGDTVRVATYAPGDSLRRSANLAATKSSLQPRELPVIEDLGRVLSEATRWRNGLPQIVQRLAQAAAAGASVVDQEVDVLRVHLDTARYQLLVQYPEVNPALLLNCLLLAATEGISSGDAMSANYHLAWYQKLDAPTMN